MELPFLPMYYSVESAKRTKAILFLDNVHD